MEDAVSTLKNPDYNTVIKFKDLTYGVSYVHKIKRGIEKEIFGGLNLLLMIKYSIP